MEPRTGARVRRFESVEIGAVAVIVLASIVQGLSLYRLLPELASLQAGAGEAWSLPLRLYVEFCRWSLILAPVALVAWIAFQIAGRPLPSAIRRNVLTLAAAFAGPVTIAGLYVMAEESLMRRR